MTGQILLVTVWLALATFNPLPASVPHPVMQHAVQWEGSACKWPPVADQNFKQPEIHRQLACG